MARIGRDLRRNTNRSQRSINQAAEGVKLNADKRMEEALKRQSNVNKSENNLKNTPPMRGPRIDAKLNTFFHSATKSFVQSQEQYRSLVSILSSQPQAAEKLAEEGAEDIKGLFATLSSMLGRGAPAQAQPKPDSKTESD